MPSKLRFKRLIFDTEKALRKCWQFVASFREGQIKPSLRTDLQDFQMTLAAALRSLSAAHARCLREQRLAVSRKTGASCSASLIKLLRRAGGQLEIIDKLVKTAKSLGDGLAWFFYIRDKPLLRKHLDHPGNKLVPSGFGGLGELEFIRNVPSLGRYFALYHGITSILRCGDFSFVDMRTLRVAGVAEIKTQVEETTDTEYRLRVLCQFVSRTKPDFVAECGPKHDRCVSTDDKPNDHEFDPAIMRRLRRQVKAMASLLQPVSDGERVSRDVEFQSYAKELGELCSNASDQDFTHLVCGKCLVLTAIRLTHSSLYRQFRGSKTDFQGKLGKLDEHVMCIIESDQEFKRYNSLTVAPIGPQAMPGTTPLIWWPLPSSVVKDLIFGQVSVISSFNPAALLKRLVEQGFEVKLRDGRHNIEVQKRVGDAMLEFRGIHYFLGLIQFNLVSEGTVCEVFQSITDAIPPAPDGKSGTILLDLSGLFGLDLPQRSQPKRA